MNKTLPACLLSLAALVPLSAHAAEPLVRFEGGIGVIPVNTAGANVVLGVNPGGQPWVISSLSADVSTDGKINVDGRGLLLAGSNNIGRTGGQSVRARLFCDGIASDSTLVPLEPNGDFKIAETLIPTPPVPCTTPVLLIVSGGGNGFAAGFPQL
jgi:hypothetical protein